MACHGVPTFSDFTIFSKRPREAVSWTPAFPGAPGLAVDHSAHLGKQISPRTPWKGPGEGQLVSPGHGATSFLCVGVTGDKMRS